MQRNWRLFYFLFRLMTEQRRDVSVMAVSEVYFMSTACGHPQGGGVRLMWTHVYRGEGGQKAGFCGRHKWMAPMCLFEAL